MKTKRTLRRILLAIAAAWLLLIAWGFVYAWRPLAGYTPEDPPAASVARILTQQEYDGIIDTHPRPLTVEGVRDGGAVMVYGAEHTKDPQSPSLVDIQAEFQRFQPTVVLCEGRMTGLLFPGLMDPVTTFGESGFVRSLGYRQSLPVYTWEPSPEQEIDGLLDQGFSQEQVALRLILNSWFSNRRFGESQPPDQTAAELLSRKRDWPTVGRVFANVSELDAAWARHFPTGPDWRDVSDEFGLPGFLGEMDGNLVRDRHLLGIIEELMNQQERVFVIAGCSHAAKLRPALIPSMSRADVTSE